MSSKNIINLNDKANENANVVESEETQTPLSKMEKIGHIITGVSGAIFLTLFVSNQVTLGQDEPHDGFREETSFMGHVLGVREVRLCALKDQGKVRIRGEEYCNIYDSDTGDCYAWECSNEVKVNSSDDRFSDKYTGGSDSTKKDFHYPNTIKEKIATEVTNLRFAFGGLGLLAVGGATAIAGYRRRKRLERKIKEEESEKSE